MADLTSTARTTLVRLTPGLWQELDLGTDRSLSQLSETHPELCEKRMVETGCGLVAQYRLTPAGERERTVAP